MRGIPVGRPGRCGRTRLGGHRLGEWKYSSKNSRGLDLVTKTNQWVGAPRDFASTESSDWPFSRERLNRIFQVSEKHVDRLSSRESSDLEFKKSFHLSSLAEYMRTCAAFANTKGGHIVFGINDRPRTMVGLKGQRFEDLDEAKLTGHFNEHFAPEIRWQAHVYELISCSLG